jgi:quinol monooxygenase YgiN
MHILHVHCHIKPEHLEAFKEATNENAANSRQEEGVARFDVIQQNDDPTRLVLMEVYYSAEGHAKHRETAHYNAWIAKVADWFSEPRTRTVYTSVSPGEEDW